MREICHDYGRVISFYALHGFILVTHKIGITSDSRESQPVPLRTFYSSNTWHYRDIIDTDSSIVQVAFVMNCILTCFPITPMHAIEGIELDMVMSKVLPGGLRESNELL